MKALPLAGLIALALAACSKAPESTPAAADTAAAAAAAPADADLATRSPVDARQDSPARLDGYGDVALGAGIAEVRAGYGTPLLGLGTDAQGKPLPADDGNEGCYYLRPEGAQSPKLMIEARKLVRYDVADSRVVAPGGGRVGMTLGELQMLYPDRGDVVPDKYDAQARHLRVRPAEQGQAIVDFTVAADGKVSQWRVGLPPQVDYVEGCG